MSEPHSGLCLGGPRDGQLLTVPHEFFEVHTVDSIPIRPPFPPASSPEGFVPVQVETFTYRFWPFQDQGFWVDARAPYPILSDVIRALAAGYKARVKLCG